MEISWKKFKEIAAEDEKESNRDSIIIYRGQENSEWPIESTLFRFLKGKGQSKSQYHFSKYFNIVKKLIETNRQLKEIFDFPKDPLHLIGPLLPPQHIQQANQIICAYTELRHYGFPSPIIDWTLNPLKAAYFAFSRSKPGKKKVIYSIKQQLGFKFDHTQPTLYSLDHNYISENCLLKNSSPDDTRHLAQQSCYTMILHNGVYEFYGPDNPNKHNPYISLIIEKSHLEPIFTLIPYVIEDSDKEEMVANILKELKERNITKETLLVNPTKIILKEEEYNESFMDLLSEMIESVDL